MLLTKTVSLERRTLACIWYLGNTETFRSVSDRFGVSKGTLHHYLSKFTEVMQRHQILKNLISWPNSDEEYSQISEKFSARAGFPNVVGALDGTYIPISGPTTFRDSYICRKGFPAMHLQAVCDSSLRFLDVYRDIQVLSMTLESTEIALFMMLSRISQVSTIYWEIQHTLCQICC